MLKLEYIFFLHHSTECNEKYIFSGTHQDLLHGKSEESLIYSFQVDMCDFYFDEYHSMRCTFHKEHVTNAKANRHSAVPRMTNACSLAKARGTAFLILMRLSHAFSFTPIPGFHLPIECEVSTENTKYFRNCDMSDWEKLDILGEQLI